MKKYKYENIKNNESGITILVLVITIIILLILAGVSVGTGNKVLKESKLENLKTNMMLIKVKGKEYVENANFNLGTAFDNLTDENEKNNRIGKAKENLKKGTEVSTYNEMIGNMGITESQFQDEKSKLAFYYKLSTQDLNDMGLTNVKSDEENGWYIIKYDIKGVEVEIYNDKGFENGGTNYYSLTDIEKIDI